MIREACGIQEGRYHLSLGGRLLHDSNTLEDVGATRGSTLHSRGFLLGGGFVDALKCFSCGSKSRIIPDDEVLHKRASALLKRADLRGPAGVCRIPALEDRAVTMEQIESLWGYVESHCKAQGWTAWNSSMDDTAVTLEPEATTWYDLVAWVIKPATKEDNCSFVELVARAPQSPTWFVSHWWGGPVSLLRSCLLRHSRDRQLLTANYWVAALACNHHIAESGPGLLDAETGLRGAMRKAEGTVAVIDEEGATFKRAWCAFEMHAALEARLASRASGGKPYHFDVYCALLDPDDDGDSQGSGEVPFSPLRSHTSEEQPTAVGLVDGGAADDRDDLGASSQWLKARRERCFSPAIAARALNTTVRTAEATRPRDRVRILNALAGRQGRELDSNPEDRHPRYAEVDRLLRGYIAAALWAVAALSDWPAKVRDQLRERLHESALEEVDVFCVSAPHLIATREALPLDRLRALGMEIHRQVEIVDVDVEALLGALSSAPRLARFELALWGNKITDTGAELLGRGVANMPQLSHLHLRLDSSRIADGGVRNLAAHLAEAPKLVDLRLNLGFNAITDVGASAVGEALARAPLLGSLELHMSFAAVTDAGVGALGSALAGARNLLRIALHLDSNKITAVGAKTLAAALAVAPRLEELGLHLWDNRVGDAGAAAVTASLAGAPQLKHLALDLWKNQVGDDGAQGLADGLVKARHMNSFKLSLRDNDVTDVGVARLAQCLARVPNLAVLELNLIATAISQEGVAELAKGLLLCTHLASVTIYIQSEFHGLVQEAAHGRFQTLCVLADCDW